MPLHPLSFASHELRGLCRDGVALLLQVDKLYGKLNVADKWRASGGQVVGKWWASGGKRFGWGGGPRLQCAENVL